MKDGERKEAREFLPPLEFGSIVVLLYLPALVELGLMPDPTTGQTRQNLGRAKRNIDLLDLLKDRSKGNLEKEEEEALEDALRQLKMAYLNATDILKT